MILPDVLLVKMPVTILQLVGNFPFYLALNNEFLPYYKQDITVTEELPDLCESIHNYNNGRPMGCLISLFIGIEVTLFAPSFAAWNIFTYHLVGSVTDTCA